MAVDEDRAIEQLKERVESGLADLARYYEPDEVLAYVKQIAARMQREIKEGARS